MTIKKLRIFLWLILTFLILCSIGVMYYVFMVQKDYEIFTLPEGPDTSDYFEE